MAELDARTTNLGSSIFQFRVEYEQNKKLPIGKYVHSDVVSVGGHLWRIEFFPCGDTEVNREYISIYLSHRSKSTSVRAIFDVFVIERHVTFVCAITVINDNPILVPPSDIKTHLGHMLDHANGTDVSFIIEDETFHAHRVVLAARSPVFRAELFGSMAEATMSPITLHNIAPATFKIMLRFIYTDEFPAEDEPEDSSVDMFQNLLAAAHRFALDRLKFICAQKLWDKVAVDTVATILACAETYNFHELKNKCIDFFAGEKNFQEVVFTGGYGLLVLKFPSIAAELKKRVRA
ncbi:hypothetical protein ACQ4PT_039107 [Festuca glaucescens]